MQYSVSVPSLQRHRVIIELLEIHYLRLSERCLKYSPEHSDSKDWIEGKERSGYRASEDVQRMSRGDERCDECA